MPLETHEAYEAAILGKLDEYYEEQILQGEQIEQAQEEQLQEESADNSLIEKLETESKTDEWKANKKAIQKLK
jgi:hypothetical protein